MGLTIVGPYLGVAFEHDIWVATSRLIDHRFVVIRQHPQSCREGFLLRHYIDRPGDKLQCYQLLENAGRDADETAAKLDQRRPAIEREPYPYLATGAE